MRGGGEQSVEGDEGSSATRLSMVSFPTRFVQENRVLKAQLERASTDSIDSLVASGHRMRGVSMRREFAPQVAADQHSRGGGGSGIVHIAAALSAGRDRRLGSRGNDAQAASLLAVQGRSRRALSSSGGTASPAGTGASPLSVGRSRRVVSGAGAPAAPTMGGDGVEMVSNPLSGSR